MNPYGLLCGGLLLLITVPMKTLIFSMLIVKIADREISRKVEVEKTLNFIHRQLGQLNVIHNLPKTEVPPTALINRSIDVKSAALTYIAVHLRYVTRRLGFIGHLSKVSTAYDRKYNNDLFQRVSGL